MTKKALKALTVVVVGLGVTSGAYFLGSHQGGDKDTKSLSSSEQTVKSSASKVKKSSSTTQSNEPVSAPNEVESTSVKASSYSTTDSFSASGEMHEVASEMSAIMTAKSGAKITKENVDEARQQLRQQGISDGPFSDLDIAKVIDKANEDSLDYKSAIEEIYPHYFD